jgi:hypothetical protein
MSEGVSAMDEIARADFTSFPQAPPPTPAEQKKIEKENAKKSTRVTFTGEPESVGPATKGPKKPTPAQLKKAALAETAAERASLIRKITQYHRAFSDKIKTTPAKDLPNLDSCTVEELSALIHDIELDIGGSGAEEIISAVLLNASANYGNAAAAFPVLNPLKLPLWGPKIDMQQGTVMMIPAWKPLIMELAIKYERWFASGPELRAAMLFVRTVMMVAQMNKEEMLREATPVSSGVASAMSDIFGSANGKGKEEEVGVP